MGSAYRPTGVFVPLVTPFGRDGAVDLDALERLAGEVLADAARGVVGLATTGEPTSLDDAERAATVAACARACAEHGAELIVGAGTCARPRPGSCATTRPSRPARRCR